MRASFFCVALATASAWAQGTPKPPPALACLTRFYALTPVQTDGGVWVGKLPDGTLIPERPDASASDAEREEHPSAEELLVPYVRGPARPIEDPDENPGRIRSDALFDATYGRGRSLKLATVQIGGRRVSVNAAISERLERVAKMLRVLAAKDSAVARAIANPAGGYNDRNIAGTQKRSAHSWGVAVDLDTRISDYWHWRVPRAPWRNRMPQSVVDAFEAEGFIWGGRWYLYDTMHFEYRPELLDPACQAVAH